MTIETTCAPNIRAGRRYRMLGLLGKGGFGRVYQAQQAGDQGFTRVVAIKVGNTDLGEFAMERLREEARILTLVRHRAIVQVDDLIELDGTPAIVMEYVDGVDLARVLTQSPLPTGPALEIVAEVAGALDAAQRARGPQGHPLLLQHQDVKPANIMITASGVTKLLDFGVAYANLVDTDDASRPSCGSRGYVAPERTYDDPHFNSDVYSLGVVLYECLSGCRFGVPPIDPRKHPAWCRRSLRALPEDVPTAVRNLLSDMLAYAPEDRPTPRELERRARSIARTAATSLRDWAERLPELQLRTGFASVSARLSERRPTSPAGGYDSSVPLSSYVLTEPPSPLPAEDTVPLLPLQPGYASLLSPRVLAAVLALWASAATAVMWTG